MDRLSDRIDKERTQQPEQPYVPFTHNNSSSDVGMGVCLSVLFASCGSGGCPKYRLPQVRAKLAFQLLNRVGPFEGPGSLIVVANKVLDGLL
jgi:hypothetical protein